jgi:hypothetical protein
MNAGDPISVSSTGAFDYATTVPTQDDFAGTSSNSIKIHVIDENSVEGESASSAFSRTPRSLTLDPSTASPGESVLVSVTGMTVDNNEMPDVNAQFSVDGGGITLSNSKFPIDSTGAGSGIVTIPIDTDPGTFTWTAADNAGALNDGASNRSATASLKVPSGTVMVDPALASTGNFITISGTEFPPNSFGSSLKIGDSSAFPAGGFTTDSNGEFSVLVEVPADNEGGSLRPGTQIIKVTVGGIKGSSTGFAIPNPSITITPSIVSVEDDLTITGTGFDSLVTADLLKIGNPSAMPSPAPRAARNGDITVETIVPLLNPGTYTVTLETGSSFSATATLTIVGSGSAPSSSASLTADVFADLISNGDNLVRVWRYDNASGIWSFFDPRPEFADANTLVKTGPGDIVWVNVLNAQDFNYQNGTALVSA